MSTKIVIKTTDRVVPMIYAYTTPEIARHNGWTKIGYTEQDVDKRLSQQTHTADVEYKEEWRGNATFEDGSGDTFTDKDFHRYLRKLNIENDPKNEWFHVTGPASRNHFYDFRANRGILQSLTAATPYNLREEQEDAVEKTLDYSRLHTKGEYLWNAKPRFGKTLTAYELCKQMDADTVLIVTNRPAIANSWYSDYEKFLGPDSGYLFVSDTSSLQGKPFVVSRNQYLDMLNNDDYKCIEFVSLQDLKGSIYFGGEFEKLKEVNDIHWDVLIIDEAHEGVDTYKTDVAFDHIDRNFTLHLSGRQVANETIDVFGRSIIFGLVEHPQRLVVIIAFLAIIAGLSANHQTTNPEWSIRVCHKRRPERRISGQDIRQITGERSVQPENQIRDAVNQLWKLSPVSQNIKPLGAFVIVSGQVTELGYDFIQTHNLVVAASLFQLNFLYQLAGIKLKQCTVGGKSSAAMVQRIFQKLCRIFG